MKRYIVIERYRGFYDICKCAKDTWFNPEYLLPNKTFTRNYLYEDIHKCKTRREAIGEAKKIFKLRKDKDTFPQTPEGDDRTVFLIITEK